MTGRQHSAVVRELAAWCRAMGAYPNAAFTVGSRVLGDIADLLDELLDLRAKEEPTE